MNTNRDPMAAKQHDAVIDGENCVVWIAKDGVRWRASGMFRRRRIEVRGDYESAALRAWIEASNRAANE